MTQPLHGNEIAIVGMAGRFPGAPDLGTFWRNLVAGTESIERLGEPASGFVPVRAMVDRPEYFDAAFFGISPRDAALMDPQHRLLLECAWEALESAGYDGRRHARPIGVFCGSMINTYLLCHLMSSPGFLEEFDIVQVNVSNGADFLATRVSYKLGLKGPSVSVQTACSTSLVAVHLACQSILDGTCDMAIAGGVALNLKVRSGYRFQPDGIVSPDGHCRAFDAAAGGTVFGSGVGVVVLKRATAAVAAGDTIHALIKGTAVNNDGGMKAGFTAPSVQGQAAVIREALANAGVAPETIGYVEAHGTGTALGDPIEVRALSKAYRTAARGGCALGSVKTNIGHLDAAAGVAGLIKTVLAVREGELPPSLHYVRANPQIDFAGSPFYVNTTRRAWPGTGPRRAGVSAFGVGGTNAHVIVEEAPARAASGPSRDWQLLVWSAKSASALRVTREQIARALRDGTSPLADVAYTLALGRSAFEQRGMAVCRDATDAAAVLERGAPERVRTQVAPGRERPVVLLLPGQGAQRVQMGRGLYAHEAVYRATFDACADVVQETIGVDLRAVVYPAAGQEADAAALLDQTGVTQPALFAVEYALAQQWIAWGVTPTAMVGHSVGEYVAACLAGVLEWSDALRVVCARGQAMQAAPTGAMLAVALSEADAAALTDAELVLAAVNGPAQCVLAGPVERIAEVAAALTRDGVGCRRLATSHAFHSPSMIGAQAAVAAALAAVPRQAPQRPFISNVTGTWIEADAATDPAYWAEQLCAPVRCYDGLLTVTRGERPVLLEVGPGTTLGRCCRALPGGAQLAVIETLPPTNDAETEVPTLLESLGRLWLEGVAIDWTGVFAGETRHRVPLPTYPFERQRFWIDPADTAPRAASHAERPAIASHDVEPALAPAPTPTVAHPRPLLAVPYAAPVSGLERRLATLWQQALGIDRIGLDDNFFDLGGDSLVAVQLMADARAALACDLPVVALYEYVTVRSMARAVDAHLSNRRADPIDAGHAVLARRNFDRARRVRQQSCESS